MLQTDIQWISWGSIKNTEQSFKLISLPVGPMLTLCVVGTGLEGCWLTWHILQADLNQSWGTRASPGVR